jgi:hypothetical protein
MDELSRAFFQQHNPRQMDERPFVQDITNPKKKDEPQSSAHEQSDGLAAARLAVP